MPRGEVQGKFLPFHPLLLAAYPVLNLYSRNMDEVPPSAMLPALVVSVLGSAVLWGVLTALTRDYKKAALATSVMTVLFFSYGHISNLLPHLDRDATAMVCIISLAILLYLIYRCGQILERMTVFTNTAACVTVFLPCIYIGSKAVSRGIYGSAGGRQMASLIVSNGSNASVYGAGSRIKRVSLEEGVNSVTAGSAQPDIYYVVLDAYGRADSLKDFLGFDNSAFVSELNKRGFYVASQSRSNYAQTGFSLPASLNMDYFDVLLRNRGSKDDLFESQRRLVDENTVAEKLRERGYRYIYIWTGTEVTHVHSADLILDGGSAPPPSSFTGELLSLTALDIAPELPSRPLGFAADYERHRGYILTAFHNLQEVARLPFPKFVLAHVCAPHPPFVFGPQGQAVNPRYPFDEADGSELLKRITRDQYRAGYIDQLKYVNKCVLDAVDSIARNSRHAPIIILQGDHGSRMNLDWTSQERTELREPFSILNAYLVPPSIRKNLYAGITPVNSFRMLLNNMFGENMPLLPDRSLFSLPAHPLTFSDVTSKVRPIPKDSLPASLHRH